MEISGALKKKESANTNSETGCYYQELVEKNKAGKKSEYSSQIDKVISAYAKV